jgi:hypothetical protein
MDVGDRTLLQRSKSRRWVGNVERMEEIRNANKIFVQKDLGLDGLILKIKKGTGCYVWIGSIWLTIGVSGALVVYPD